MSSPSNYLYEFGPFVLDAGSRILLKDGATVRLTPRALQTLLVLVRHAAQVVDKEQLLNEVWTDSFVEEGNLSRNIYELRRALGDDPAEPRFIETVPKRGYRFVAPVDDGRPPAIHQQGGTDGTMAKLLWTNVAELRLLEEQRKARQRLILTVSVIVAALAVAGAVAYWLLRA